MILSMGFVSAKDTAIGLSPAAGAFKQSARDGGNPQSLYFVANRGQVANGVKFYALGNPSVALRDDGVMFVLKGFSDAGVANPMLRSGDDDAGGSSAREFAYLLRFEGANSVTPVGGDRLSFNTNFFIGNDRSKWQTNVPTYGEVIYRNLYSGIDLVYRAGSDGLKYDFVIGPGANPSTIRIGFEGVDGLRVDGSRISIDTPYGSVSDSIPRSYQASGREVQCGFSLRGAKTVGFDCIDRDPSEALTIDPLVYSTYFGGNNSDSGIQMTADAAGNAYVTGYTYSPDFPVTPGAYNTTITVNAIFVSKLNPAGSGLVYSTFIGHAEVVNAIAVDSLGNAYITGWTDISNYPTTPGAYETTFPGGEGNGNAFVTKLNANGDALVFSTFLGGRFADDGRGIKTDSTGNVYVVGITVSNDFPVTAQAYQKTIVGMYYDGFVTKLDPAGSSLIYSTLLGGSDWDEIAAIAIDSLGYAYVAGHTGSADFPITPGAFNTTMPGGVGTDSFVTKVGVDGDMLNYSTYLGGTNWDEARSIAVDSSGNAYVTGYTQSADFPVTPGAFRTSLIGLGDAFLTKLNASGDKEIYSTFLGGSKMTDAFSLAVGPDRRAYISGRTNSTDFPVTLESFGNVNSGKIIVFVTVFNSVANSVDYSTLLGGSTGEEASSLALDSRGFVYIAGMTFSPDFPTTPGAFRETALGQADAYVAKINVNNPPTISLSNPGDLKQGDNHTITWSMSDKETPVAQLVVYLNYSYGGVTHTIAGPLVGATSYVFHVPAINATDVRFNATVIDSGGLKGWSETPAFEIYAERPGGESNTILVILWYLIFPLTIFVVVVILIIAALGLKKNHEEKSPPPAPPAPSAPPAKDEKH